MAALFKKSSLVSAARGRVGGNIFSRGQSGSTIKSARKAVQVYSPESSFQKTALKKIISLWKTGVSYMSNFGIFPDPYFSIQPLTYSLSHATSSFYNNKWHFSVNPGYDYIRVYRLYKPAKTSSFILNVKLDPNSLINVSSVLIRVYSVSPTIYYYYESISDLNDVILRNVLLEIPNIQTYIVLSFFGDNFTVVIDKFQLYTTKNAFAQIWNSAAQNFTAKNVFGVRRNISGYELFSKLNLNLLRLGQSTIQDPPTPSILVPFKSLIFAVSASSLQIRTDVQELDAHTAFLVFLSRPVSKTVDRCRNQDYKQMPNTLTIVSGAIECLPEWSEKFGYSVVPVNSKIFCKVKTYDKASGQLLTTTSLDVVRLV